MTRAPFAQACMGGWCALRDHCPHYHATFRGQPFERLCDRSEPDSDASRAHLPVVKPRQGCGVRTLDQLKGKCRMGDDGCWNWAGATTKQGHHVVPKLHIPAGALPAIGGGKETTLSAYRAAWLFAGKPEKPGKVVYRTCCNVLCVNPAHLALGTKAEMHAHVAASGKNKGLPHRKVANAINRMLMVTPLEKVRKAEEMAANGVKQKDIAASLEINLSTVALIRKGQHPHSRARAGLATNTSVFTWRPAA